MTDPQAFGRDICDLLRKHKIEGAVVVYSVEGILHMLHAGADERIRADLAELAGHFRAALDGLFVKHEETIQ